MRATSRGIMGSGCRTHCILIHSVPYPPPPLDDSHVSSYPPEWLHSGTQHCLVVVIHHQCDLSCLPEVNLHTVLGGQSGIAMSYVRKSVLDTDTLETEKSKRWEIDDTFLSSVLVKLFFGPNNLRANLRPLDVIWSCLVLIANFEKQETGEDVGTESNSF